MNWTNVRLIFMRELRDQLRDRRTLFTIAVLPILLYPLLGMGFLQVIQFNKEHPTGIWVLGAENLPDEPVLIEDGKFHEDLTTPRNAHLINLDLQRQASRQLMEAVETLATSGEGDLSRDELAEVRSVVQEALESTRQDALVYFPADFGADLRSAHDSGAADHVGPATPQPKLVVLLNSASDKSRMAGKRVESVITRWRDSMVKDNLEEKRISAADTEPFEFINQDIAGEESRRAAIWSRIFPFVMLVWALTGAFYPAIDLCAGEKERGTLETLLSSPARRVEIVWGKLLTIQVFSMSTALLNLASMGFTGLFLLNQLSQLNMEGGQLEIGPPPIASMGWLILAMIPVSALFSALSLAVAAFARSSKEGQYYLMPLLLITLPLMMLPVLPAAELNLGTSLIPVSGIMLLLRSLIEGQYGEAIRFALPVIAVTAACCLLAIRWAVDQFNNESVLFRESERLGLGLWVRQLVRDRGMLPTIGEAILCGLIILMIRFFANFAAEMPENWTQFAKMTVISLLATVATPACLMAIMLTRSPGTALQLTLPKIWTLPAAILLAICLNPLIFWFSRAVVTLYPPSPELIKLQESLGGIFDGAPSIWAMLAIVALTPAICEELAFRGFILSGLNSRGNKWMAILVSSFFFGATHGILQQSISACVTGAILGYVAVQTKSIFPCILYHLVHNGVTLLIGTMSPETISQNGLLDFVFDIRPVEAGVGTATYGLIPGLLMIAGGGALLYAFSRLRDE